MEFESRRGIYYLGIVDNDEGFQPQGTGFVVEAGDGDKRLISCHHVVHDCLTSSGDREFIYALAALDYEVSGGLVDGEIDPNAAALCTFVEDDEFKLRREKLLKEGKLDLAVLSLKRPNTDESKKSWEDAVPIRIQPLGEIYARETYQVIGYDDPKDSTNKDDHRIGEKTGQIKSRLKHKGFMHYVLSPSNLKPGYSGSPVLVNNICRAVYLGTWEEEIQRNKKLIFVDKNRVNKQAIEANKDGRAISIEKLPDYVLRHDPIITTSRQTDKYPAVLLDRYSERPEFDLCFSSRGSYDLSPIVVPAERYCGLFRGPSLTLGLGMKHFYRNLLGVEEEIADALGDQYGKAFPCRWWHRLTEEECWSVNFSSAVDVFRSEPFFREKVKGNNNQLPRGVIPGFYAEFESFDKAFIVRLVQKLMQVFVGLPIALVIVTQPNQEFSKDDLAFLDHRLPKLEITKFVGCSSHKRNLSEVTFELPPQHPLSIYRRYIAREKSFLMEAPTTASSTERRAEDAAKLRFFINNGAWDNGLDSIILRKWKKFKDQSMAERKLVLSNVDKREVIIPAFAQMEMSETAEELLRLTWSNNEYLFPLLLQKPDLVEALTHQSLSIRKKFGFLKIEELSGRLDRQGPNYWKYILEKRKSLI